MKKVVTLISLFLCVSLFCLSGCGANRSDTSSASLPSSSISSDASIVSPDSSSDQDLEPIDQFAMPEEGETIVVFHVKDYGVFKARLFPEAAPKAVENFLSLARDGKYNGVSFHRVIEDFMIQTGDTTQVGQDGNSIYGEGFGIEPDARLRHYTGALAMARTADTEKGQSTQFYVVNNQSNRSLSQDDWDYYESAMKQNYGVTVTYPEEVQALYQEHGGAPHLDMMYTVFGQVFEGLDVVDAISKVEVELNTETGETTPSVPTTPVILESIEVVEYHTA